MPGRIDQNRPFLPVNIAILTVFDTRGCIAAPSGDTLADLVIPGTGSRPERSGRDEQEVIVAQLKECIVDPDIDVVISTGGTGVTGRDVTPEAFHSVYEKEIAGFGELFRWLSYEKVGTSTIQNRVTAGVAGGTYLFTLPGSPSARRDPGKASSCTNSTTGFGRAIVKMAHSAKFELTTSAFGGRQRSSSGSKYCSALAHMPAFLARN
jgi:molybdenum cofactor biosynthesis protein B